MQHNEYAVTLVYPKSSEFIRTDLEILSEFARVYQVRLDTSRNGLKNPREFAANLTKLAKCIAKSSITFIWFADIHALLAAILSRLFGKKVIINIGGYELASFREYNYGMLRTPWRRAIVKLSLRLSTLVLVVSKHLKEKAIRELGCDPSKVLVLSTGYDPEKFKRKSRKEPLVLTVALVKNKSRFYIKGIDVFLSLARRMRDVQFKMIGVDKSLLLNEGPLPENVEVVGQMDQDELIKEYSRSKVFCLFSRHEGLPNVLCEAMLCECIPVGNNIEGIREVIEGVGFLVDVEDIQAVESAVRKALFKTDPNAGLLARKRIVERYNINHRRALLRKIVSELIHT